MVALRTALILAVPWLLVAEDGLAPVIGGLSFDAGFGLGVESRKSRLIGGPLDIRAKALTSVRSYELLEMGVAAPRLAHEPVFAEVLARYRNDPEEELWELGPKPSRDRRTNFRFEGIDCKGIVGVRPKRWLEFGAAGGMLNVNTGTGKYGDWPSAE